MSNRIAILDLGTNTFHLLIVEVQENKQYSVLYKAEKFVKLAEESITHIGDKAFARGISLLEEYNKVIEEYKPERIFAFGTAALRRAGNANDFIKEALRKTGIAVKVISGDEEAKLICDGVRKAVSIDEHPALIMDIGGGSTEFIIANKDKIFWKQSFQLGVSVLKPRFHLSEPISSGEKRNLVEFLEKELMPLFEQKKSYTIHHLVGASGSFDSFASMIAGLYYSPAILAGKTSFDMKPVELKNVFSLLKTATLEERLQMRGLLAFRAEMIVMAAILTEVVVKHFAITRISQSAYALKEGVLTQLIS